jgi:hypothetical protein
VHLFSSSSWVIMLCNSLCGWIILESCKISEVEVPDSVCPLCTLLWVGTSLVLWLETEKLSVKAIYYTSTLKDYKYCFSRYLICLNNTLIMSGNCPPFTWYSLLLCALSVSQYIAAKYIKKK